MSLLFQKHIEVIYYLRTTHIFARNSQGLRDTIDLYLDNPVHFDRKDMSMVAVDSVHKLHPLDYGTSIVRNEWLLDACLRQNEFAMTLPMDQLDY
jgi:hypothetical protein